MLIALTLLLATPTPEGTPSPESAALEMIRTAIETVAKGQLDTFVQEFCDPERCHTELSIANWKAYQLKAMRTNGAYCLHGRDRQLEVVRWEGSLAEDPRAKVFLSCTNRQLPVPVEVRWDASAARAWIRAVSF